MRIAKTKSGISVASFGEAMAEQEPQPMLDDEGKPVTLFGLPIVFQNFVEDEIVADPREQPGVED